MLKPLLKAVLPVAAMAIAAGLSGCKDVDISFNGEEGVPLADLDMSGDPPKELVLAGPDKVILSTGDTLAIDVSGDEAAAEALRFSLKGGKLAIIRSKGFSGGGAQALVRVTMPAPETITVAGSGSVEATSLADDAKVVIAGSGAARADAIAVDSLNITIAGSGRFEAGGSARALDLDIAGSGIATMDALAVEEAKVNVAGSGDASFASDGKVEAKIVGSGNVVITGRATCTVKSMGSGSVTCRPAGENTGPDTETD